MLSHHATASGKHAMQIIVHYLPCTLASNANRVQHMSTCMLAANTAKNLCRKPVAFAHA